MILPAQNIVKAHEKLLAESSKGLLTPFWYIKQVQNGKSFGMSHAGYDVRINLENKPDSGIWMSPGRFILAHTVEEFNMPLDVMGIVHDKSSWAREGIAVQNTVIEPGWRGWLTLEITNHHESNSVFIKHGDPIAQIVFHRLEEPTLNPYSGKYQDQPNRPVKSLKEV